MCEKRGFVQLVTVGDRGRYGRRAIIEQYISNRCAFRVYSECIQSAFKNSGWLDLRFEAG